MSTYIYTSEKIMPYVYMCIHKITKQFYIGYRCSNKKPSHIDLPIYKTSSKKVKPIFNEFDWFIVAEFFNKQDAHKFEVELIKEMWDSPLKLNQKVLENWSTAGNTHTAEVRDICSKAVSKRNSNSRWYNNGKCNKFCQLHPGQDWQLGRLNQKPTNKGKKWYNNGIEQKQSATPIKNWNTGMLPKTEEQRKNISKAKTGKKLSESHKLNLSKVWKGKKHSEQTKQKMRHPHKQYNYNPDKCPSKQKFLSIISTKKTYNKSSISKLYPEFKKYY